MWAIIPDRDSVVHWDMGISAGKRDTERQIVSKASFSCRVCVLLLLEVLLMRAVRAMREGGED
jgi:hypothetical protein